MHCLYVVPVEMVYFFLRSLINTETRREMFQKSSSFGGTEKLGLLFHICVMCTQSLMREMVMKFSAEKQ